MSEAAPGSRRFEYKGSARSFAWYELHADEVFACRCGWTGRFDAMAGELFRELVDGSCPKCDTRLVIRSYPTILETREAAVAGDPIAVRELADADKVEQRWDRAQDLELKADSPLPQLEGPRLRFDWDFEEAEDEHWTVIRCAGLIVWRELAYWEGWSRFDVVKALLRARFGEPFDGLHPTEGSKVYLYGDDISATVTPY